MTTRSSAGSTLKVSATIPATFNTAGYAALTYTAVGEITNLGEFGRVYNLIKHNPLATRATVKKKGSYDEGQLALQLALDTDDAGQIVMKAASQSDNDYSIEVTTQNGDKYYMQVQVMSWKVNVGSVDQITSAACALEITSSSAGVGIVESLAP
jgi:hypothetical protein